MDTTILWRAALLQLAAAAVLSLALGLVPSVTLIERFEP
jgi:anti-sigma-K factor RskA